MIVTIESHDFESEATTDRFRISALPGPGERHLEAVPGFAEAALDLYEAAEALRI